MGKKVILPSKVWLFSWVFLIFEFSKFIFNLPQYFGRIFEGFNIFAKSYNGLVAGLKSFQKTWSANKNPNTKTVQYYINETIRLRKEQEKMFSGLSTIFIAILALVISVIAIVFK
ncbi:MAG: hypothetical protein Q8P10_00730 [bacterium]|nr:hypothetical protein [bacterium]